MSVVILNHQNLQLSGSSSQKGPDNSDFKPWDLISGRITDYRFGSFRYRGCFSDVAQCRVTDTRNTVAIKIFKKMTTDSQQPNRELDILKKIQGLDPVHIVRFYENFNHKGHTCLVFETLDKNLDELLRERHGEPLSLHVIRPITQQLLSALHSLKTAGIIHTNIKPQNVMMVKQEGQQPFRVKLIGFGSAIPAAEVKCSSVMQPVGYRSPDVILGLPISEAADMWSVAAVLTTMYLGSPLFPQRCQYHLMKTLVETLGQPEDELLHEGTNTLLYFNSSEHTWTLKTPEEYEAMTGFPPQIQRRYSTSFKSLSELVKLYPDVVSDDDKQTFVSLLVKMLHLNPQKRISPTDALKHPFVSHSKEDTSDSSSHDMVSVPSVSVSPVAASPEEGDASTNTDSAASCSGVENVPAVCWKDEASDEALDEFAVSADAAISSPDDAGRNDTVSIADEASESSAILDNKTTSAEEVPKESPKADVNEAVFTSASATMVQTDLYDAVSADEGQVETPTTAEPTDEVMAEAHDSRKAPRRPLKRIRKFFGRVFRAQRCCCSARATE